MPIDPKKHGYEGGPGLYVAPGFRHLLDDPSKAEESDYERGKRDGMLAAAIDIYVAGGMAGAEKARAEERAAIRALAVDVIAGLVSDYFSRGWQGDIARCEALEVAVKEISNAIDKRGER